MASSTKVNSRKINATAREDSSGKMAESMKAAGIEVNRAVLATI